MAAFLFCAQGAPARLGSRYRVELGDLDFAPNADVRPTETNPVVLPRDGERRLEMRRWGLVPSWNGRPAHSERPLYCNKQS